MKNNATGFVALLTTGFLFATTALFVRLFEAQSSVYQQVAYRDGVVLLAALLILLARRRPLGLRRSTLLPQIGFALSYGFTFLFFSLAVATTTLTTATFAIYLSSILVAVMMGAWLFGERLRRQDLWGLLLVAIGLVAFSFPFSLSETLGLGFVYGLLTGVAQSLANTFRKMVGEQVDRYALVATQAAGGTAVGVTAALLFDGTLLSDISLSLWPMLLLYSATNFAFAYLLLVGFQNFDLNLGSIVLSSELFFAILLGIIFYAEIPTPWQLTGSLLIMIAIVVINLPATVWADGH